MRRFVLCIVALAAVGVPRTAAATPIEYNITFGLSTTGNDYLGVAGARFELSVLLDPAIAWSHLEGGTTEWTLSPGVTSIHLNIAGSAHDGLYTSAYDFGSPSLLLRTTGFSLFEVGRFWVDGVPLSLGSITGMIPAPAPGPDGRIQPFVFEHADVQSWSFSWAASPGSSYIPTIIAGSARPVGVPEPGSLALLGLGIAGAVAQQYRSRTMSVRRQKRSILR